MRLDEFDNRVTRPKSERKFELVGALALDGPNDLRLLLRSDRSLLRPPSRLCSQSGVAADGTSWITSGPAFFLPVKALSILFRAKFREELRKAGLLEQVDPAVWKRAWFVHSKAVGDGRMSLKYLATYVFRGGISDHRIIACDDHTVTFSYRRSRSNRWRRMTLDAMEFIRRFLQHALPKGLQKVRHYVFLGARAPLPIEAVRWLVTLHNGAQFVLLAATPADPPLRPPRRCAECGGQLRVVAIFPKRSSAIHDTS